MGIVGTLSTVLVIVGIGYLVTQWAVKKDTKIENRRRAAAELAGVLSGLGLKKTPEFLISYSVGDYSSMGENIVDLAKLLLSGEDAVLKEFDEVFDGCLKAKLDTEAGRALLAAKLVETGEYVYGAETVESE